MILIEKSVRSARHSAFRTGGLASASLIHSIRCDTRAQNETQTQVETQTQAGAGSQTTAEAESQAQTEAGRQPVRL